MAAKLKSLDEGDQSMGRGSRGAGVHAEATPRGLASSRGAARLTSPCHVPYEQHTALSWIALGVPLKFQKAQCILLVQHDLALPYVGVV